MSLSKRIVSICLALVFVLGALPAAAAGAAQSTIVAVKRQSSETVSGGTELVVSSGSNSAGSPIEERILSFSPGKGSAVMVAYGSGMRGFSSAAYVANWLKENGYDPVAGTNGDFYMTDTGISIGIVVTDGVLRSSDGGMPAYGVLEDGTAFIGKPSLQISISSSSGAVVSNPLKMVNKTIKNYGVYILTDDYSSTSAVSLNTLYIRMQGAEDELRVGGTVHATVAEKFYSTTPVDLKDGEIYLCATVENGNDAGISGINVGDVVTIDISAADPIWSEAEYAIGGGDMLVSGGAVQSGLDNTRQPRTAVGVRADGSTVLYTVDGRQNSWSVGMGLTDLAARMVELGCVSALNLDGGGSTAMVARHPGYDSVSTVNKPSDGSLRKGANYIFVVNTAPFAGNVAGMKFYDSYSAISGAEMKLDLKAWDSNYHTVPLPAGVTWSVSGIDSRISQDGVFTAGKQDGTAVVTASYSGISASVSIPVIGSPDEIRLYDATSGSRISGALTLAPSAVTNLRAECLINGTVMTNINNVVQWSFDGDAATLDSNGVLTASHIPGKTGTLKVTCGDTVAQVRVTVGDADVALESFEGSYANIEAGGAAIHASIQYSAAYVMRGEASGRVTYDFGSSESGNTLTLRTNFELPSNARYLRAWVYGDGSGNSVVFGGTLLDGTSFSLSPVTLDFNGYKQVSLALPSGAAKVTSLAVSLLNADRKTGTFYLDQIVAGRSATASPSVPALSNIKTDPAITPGSVLVTATLSDGGEAVDPSGVRVTMDGERIGFYYDASALLFAAIVADPQDGMLHRLTVEASDPDGNLIRHSLELGKASAKSVFADVGDHWSAPYVDYLYGRGVLEKNYTVSGEGDMNFRPTAALTRAEFAEMMANYLGIDTARYESVTLPYTDMASIPEYARGAVVAMYLEGIITGKAAKDGSLYFDPNATITRAETMTIIGRTLPKGYSDTTVSFSDASSIPDYAREYISVLVNLGIVTGYSDGTIRPSANVTRAEGAKLIYGLY